jgi:hypothetical protein
VKVRDRNLVPVKVGDTVKYADLYWKVTKLNWFLEKFRIERDGTQKWVGAEKVTLR